MEGLPVIVVFSLIIGFVFATGGNYVKARFEAAIKLPASNEDFYHNVQAVLGAKKLMVGDEKSIPLDKFKAHVKKMSQILGRTEPDDAHLNGVYNLFDLNRDTSLTEREFVLGTTLFYEFLAYDVNKDNYLSEDELVPVFDVDGGEKTISFLEFFHRVELQTRLNVAWKNNLLRLPGASPSA